MPKIEDVQQTPGRHARRARSLRVSSSLAEINVVPLIDVMLVLLVIFMVTAPMMQQGFGVQLPQSSRSTAVSAPLTITVPLSFREDGRVRLDDEAISIDVLTERVRQVLADRLEKKVMVAGDGETTMNEIMRVFDRLQDAGVQQVAVQTQPVISDRGR
jgi:biopolymer transport protein ExbD